MGLTNHTQPISHHITPLVINTLKGGDTDRQTDRQTYRHANKNDFKKHVQLLMPSLKSGGIKWSAIGMLLIVLKCLILTTKHCSFLQKIKHFIMQLIQYVFQLVQ